MEHGRIRFVTGNYYQLQGLRMVPIGLFLALVGLLNLFGMFDHFRPAAQPRLVTGVGLAGWLALGLSVAAPLYYRYRYGAIKPSARGRRNGWITAAVIGTFLLIRVDNDLHWPVSLSLLLVSASLFIAVWRDGWIRAHYLVPAVAWLVVGFQPAFNVTPAHTTRVGFILLGGLTLIVCGIGDHLLLTRTLTKPRTIDDACDPATV